MFFVLFLKKKSGHSIFTAVNTTLTTHRRVRHVVKRPGASLLQDFTHIVTLLFSSLLIRCVCALSRKLTSLGIDRFPSLWLWRSLFYDFSPLQLSFPWTAFAVCMVQVTLVHIGLWCDTIGGKQSSPCFRSLWAFPSSLLNVFGRCPEQIFRDKDRCGPRVHHNVYSGGWEPKLVPGWKYQAFLHGPQLGWQKRCCFPEE